MKNPRISAKERNLLKGAVRRVFSRSNLRRAIIEAAKIEHYDNIRSRVKKWGQCAECKQPTAMYQMQVDHIDPIIPLDLTLEDMSWDTVIDRTWCAQTNLQPLCIPCHKEKTKQERKARKQKRTG
jgi:5-methylcytosine-specific restriction endonuclease McrA